MRGVLYSNRAQVTITKNQIRENGVLVLRDDQRMLGLLFHAPRGPFYSPKAARSRWRQSGKAILAFCRVAHRTVQCLLPTVGAGHTSPVDLAADRCTSGRWLTEQSDAPPDSPVNYSHTPLTNSREWPVR
jgi:hypothetical protein